MSLVVKKAIFPRVVVAGVRCAVIVDFHCLVDLMLIAKAKVEWAWRLVNVKKH